MSASSNPVAYDVLENSILVVHTMALGWIILLRMS